MNLKPMYPVAITTRYLPTKRSRASIVSRTIFDPSPKYLTAPLTRTTGIFPAGTSPRPFATFSASSSSGGPMTLVFHGPSPMSRVTGFPIALSKKNVPNSRHGTPTNASPYTAMTEMSLVEPTMMKVVARAKMVPAMNVSTVSCRGRIQLRPFSRMNGPTASLKKDSTTHSSRRMRSRPPAMRGPYSRKASGPTTASVVPCRRR
mmetsp:Transcript_5202/g.15020  ORF Transcript_5202/g.15020 Transcript_5202/m.15020 type:complete len:204 (+) Transcript_5202:440-1051(+)